MKKIALYLLLLVSAGAYAQNPPANIAASLQRMLNDVIASPANYSPGVIMRVYLPGRWTWAGAAGKANLTTGRPAQAGDKYRIASINKSFTAVAILKLANVGKLALNDKITKYLPVSTTALIPNAAQISIRQCLNHNSGTADFATSVNFQNSLVYTPTRSIPNFELYGIVSTLPPRGVPGNDSSYYGNTNYLILKDIIERVSGQPYSTYIRNNIIIPAGLGSTTTAVNSSLTAPFLSGYLPVNGSLVDYSNANYNWALGLGEIISNTADQVRYFEKLFTGQLIPLRWVDSMSRFNLKPSTIGEGVRYGFGIWELDDFGGCLAREHGGDVFGWSSLLTYFPQQNAYVAIDFNTYELNGFRFLLRSLVCNLLNGRIYGENFRSMDQLSPQRMNTQPMPMMLPAPSLKQGWESVKPLSETQVRGLRFQNGQEAPESRMDLIFSAAAGLRVNWKGSQAIRGEWQLMNSSGQVLERGLAPLNPGWNQLSLRTGNLAAGYYLLRFNNQRETMTAGFMIQ